MSGIPTLILLIMAILTKHQVNPFVATIGDMTTISNFANDGLAFVKGDLPLQNLVMGSTGYALEQIQGKMEELSDKLDQIAAENEKRMNHILSTLIQRLPLENKVETVLTELHHIIVRIDALYDRFQYYSRDLKKYKESTITDFINTVISHQKGNLPDSLETLHRLMHPSASSNYRKPLLELIHQKNLHLSFGELCGIGSSPQQRLYEIYQTIVALESKAYLMNIFSYTMLSLYKNETYEQEMNTAASELVKRSHSYILATKEAMQNSSLFVDVCDPTNFKRGKNYVELEKAIQMFVVNELDVAGDCSKQCSDLKNTGGLRNNVCKENKHEWCPIQTCHGRLTDCESLDDTQLCEMQRESERRYAWLKTEGGLVFGDTSSCPGRIRDVQSYTSGIRLCDVCACTCAEDRGTSPAVRTISFRPQMSNIAENMVVSGVRFVLSDNMIHIQIQEGEIIAGDQVKEDSRHWVELEKFEYDPQGAYRGRRIGTFFLVNGDTKQPLRHGKDFTFITYDKRGINLDNLKAPSGHVVTGVKFQIEANTYDENTKFNLQIAIHITKFDFIKGALETKKGSSRWMSQETFYRGPPLYGIRRNQVVLSDPDNPTNVKDHTKVSDSSEAIQFTASDRKKDAGQSTVPFFDGQPVTMTASLPLSGLGIIHRGAEGSGGFLALRLLTLDLPQYLNTNI